MKDDRPIFRRTMEGLSPANDMAQAFFAKCKLGELVTLEAKRPRRLRYHRLFFAILNLISDNSDPHITPDEALFFAKLASGTGRWIEDTKGREHFIPGSISFASMDEDGFQEFVQSCIPPLTRRFMHGTAPDAVIAEAMSLAGG